MKTKRLNAHKLMLSLVCVLMAAIFAVLFVFYSGKTITNSFAYEDSEDEDIELGDEDKDLIDQVIADTESEIDVAAVLDEMYTSFSFEDYPDADPESLEEYYQFLEDSIDTYAAYKEIEEAENSGVSTCSIKGGGWIWRIKVNVTVACAAALCYAVSCSLTAECLVHAFKNSVENSVYHPFNYGNIYHTYEYDRILSEGEGSGHGTFTSDTDNSIYTLDCEFSIHEFDYVLTNDNTLYITDIYDFDYMTNRSFIVNAINNAVYALQKIGVVTPYVIKISLPRR